MCAGAALDSVFLESCNFLCSVLPAAALIQCFSCSKHLYMSVPFF